MDSIKLNRLKEVLSVPTYSRQEFRLVGYLENVLTEKGYDFTVDDLGNIFVTKGETENFPLFVAHTDTVHSVNDNLTIKEYVEDRDGHKDKLALTGYDSETNRPSGCGGDDKCGVYLALEMLDTLDNVKVAFFVGEEIGCIGSKHAVATNPEFFSNVGYAIQYDSPEGNSLSSTLMGKLLFESSENFTSKVSGLIKEHGITNWARHPFTDVWALMEGFDFCCLNLAAGYYRYHTENEYVIVDDVQNGYDLGIKLVEVLGENKYVRPNELNKDWVNNFYDLNDDDDDTSLLTEELEPITQEDVDRLESLMLIKISDWTDDDWVFYEDYENRVMYTED